MRDPRFTHKWTDEDKVRVESLLREGLSASQIAYEFKVSRNSVIGIVHRDETLKKVGFIPKHKKPANVISLPRTNVVAFPLVIGYRRFAH